MAPTPLKPYDRSESCTEDTAFDGPLDVDTTGTTSAMGLSPSKAFGGDFLSPED